MKEKATELAFGADEKSQHVPAVAAWNFGAGVVAAVCFQPRPQLIAALADRVIVPPRDPRFTVHWDCAQPLRVTLDAIDRDRFINDLRPQLILADDYGAAQPTLTLAQTAPGRYELSVPAPSRQTIAKLTVEGRSIATVGVAAHYPPEFDAIGNNHANAALLARTTGGGIIESTNIAPIDFHWPTRALPLGPIATISGVAFIAGALVRWRLK